MLRGSGYLFTNYNRNRTDYPLTNPLSAPKNGSLPSGQGFAGRRFFNASARKSYAAPAIMSQWRVLRVFGFQGFRVSGFQGFRVSGFQGFWGVLALAGGSPLLGKSTTPPASATRVSTAERSAGWTLFQHEH